MSTNREAWGTSGWIHCSSAELQSSPGSEKVSQGRWNANWAWGREDKLGVMQRKEEGSRHEGRGVFSFPADLLLPLTLELPPKTGPEDRDQRSVQISKNWLGFSDAQPGRTH